MFNEKKIQSFSPEVQQLMLQKARESILWGDNLILEQEKSLMSKLKEEGMEFIGPEQGLDIPAFVKNVRAYVWPKYENEVGKEILDAVRAAE